MSVRFVVFVSTDWTIHRFSADSVRPVRSGLKSPGKLNIARVGYDDEPER